MSEPENKETNKQEDKASKEKETREKIEKMAASAINTAKEATKVAMPYLKKGFEGGISLIKAGIESGKHKLEERKKSAEAAKAAAPTTPAAPAADAEAKKDDTSKT